MNWEQCCGDFDHFLIRRPPRCLLLFLIGQVLEQNLVTLLYRLVLNWTAALSTNHRNQLRIFMLLLAEVTITLSMGCIVCVDSNVKAVAYYNLVGCISLQPYKQPIVPTKNSIVIALVSKISNSQSDSITYCCGNTTLLFWEFQAPKIYCVYSVYSGLSTGIHCFVNSANSGRSLFSSAIDQRLRYGVLCSALSSYLIDMINHWYASGIM